MPQLSRENPPHPRSASPPSRACLRDRHLVDQDLALRERRRPIVGEMALVEHSLEHGIGGGLRVPGTTPVTRRHCLRRPAFATDPRRALRAPETGDRTDDGTIGPRRGDHRCRRNRDRECARMSARRPPGHGGRSGRARRGAGVELRQRRLALIALSDPPGGAGNLEARPVLSRRSARALGDPLALPAAGAALVGALRLGGTKRTPDCGHGASTAHLARGCAAPPCRPRRGGRPRSSDRAARPAPRLSRPRRLRGRRSRLGDTPRGRRAVARALGRRAAPVRADTAPPLHLRGHGRGGGPLPRSGRLRRGARRPRACPRRHPRPHSRHRVPPRRGPARRRGDRGRRDPVRPGRGRRRRPIRRADRIARRPAAAGERARLPCDDRRRRGRARAPR